MSDYKRHAQEVKDYVEAIDKLSVPSGYSLEKINYYIETLFSMAKFKVGQQVQMASYYPMKDAPGWVSYRHLMVPGSKATITNVDYYRDSFRYGIQFKENTWIDDKNIIHKKDRKGGEFWMAESYLEKSKAPNCSCSECQ